MTREQVEISAGVNQRVKINDLVIISQRNRNKRTIVGANFKYIKIGSYYRPLIPIALRDDDKIIDFHALIDSGADFNLFPGHIADILEIDLRHGKSEKIGGVAGSAKAYPYALD